MSGRIVDSKINPDGSVTNTYDDGSVVTQADNNGKPFVQSTSSANPGLHQIAAGLRDSGGREAGAFQFGGSPDGLQQYTNRTDARADEYRTANQLTLDRRREVQSRGLQLAAANGYQGMLNGTGPSLANSVLNRGLSNVATQQSQLMNAQPNNLGNLRAGLTGGNAAALQANSNAVGQRVNEFNTAAQGVGGIVNNLYAGDVAANSKDNGLVLANRRINDDASIFYDMLGARAREAQMNAQQGRANTRLGALETARTYEEEQQQLKNDRAAREKAGWIGAATGAGQAAANAYASYKDDNK